MRVRTRLVAPIAVVIAVLSVFAPQAALGLPDPAPGDQTAVATLDKTASATEVHPGETFTYTLTLGCSSITDTGCRGAVTTDVVPAPFVVTDAAVGAGANTAADPVINGNNVSVTWTTALGDGTQGILDATTAIVEISAMLPADVSHDVSGIPVTNTGIIEGTNFADAQGSVDVTPIVPLTLKTTPTKSFDPTSLIATEGAPVTAHLGATNQSNATVDSLVIQDPVDPTASPNPFEYAGFTGFGTVTPPAGTTGTEYEVFVDGAWVEAPNGQLPAGVDAADVRGTRVTFSGSIPAGATASVDLDLALTALAAVQDDGTDVANTVQSQVNLGAESAVGTASANLDLRQNAVTVTATKGFDPKLVVAGEPSTVTVGGSNASAIPIEELTLTEPSSGSFPVDYAFGGFTGPVAYPSGATDGEIVYHFSDGTSETVSFADGTEPPAPSGHPLETVTSFEAHFTGSIAVGGETSIPFTVNTDADATGLPTEVPNAVGVTGSNLGETGTASASDSLFIYNEQIQTVVGKQIRPNQILAVPGEVVTVSLTGGLTERPNPPDQPDGTTGNAKQIVIQDPPEPIEGNAWWNAFDLTGIAQTPVPAGSTLTIEYYDTSDGTWKTLVTGIDGATIYSNPNIPSSVSDVAGGIRFIYDDTTGAGFPPGTDLAPNFTSTLRPEGRYTGTPPFSSTDTTTVPDCATSNASSVNPLVPDASSTMTGDTCPAIELIPPQPGNGDLIDKAFGTSSSGGIKSVIARSGDTIPSTLSWSTGGHSGFQQMDITDVADPQGTPLTSSVYNAFNLTRVNPITSATDPLIAYDEVQSVQLWNGTEWVEAANDPCPTNCVGTFPGMNLTGGEQGTTTGVRLVFVESPDRATASVGNLDAPPVGSGVARSFSNDRHITLVWQVRDDRRSDGTPVLGDETYTLPQNGVVRNTVNATGFPATGTPISANDQDDVTIIDVPLTTTTDKNWQGGPLAVPPDPSIPVTQYPLSRLTITTRNTTPAKVDQLIIQDPAPGSTSNRTDDPFQAFSFNNFNAITVPTGATSTVVTLLCPDGSSHAFTRDDALALTAATVPCDVSGIRIEFDGRIASNAAGVIALDVRLRPFWRDQPTERVSPADSPISNTAQGVVADVDPFVSCPPPQGARYACDQARAFIALEEPSFGVTAGKTISPASQKENDFSPVTATLTLQPTGSARTLTAITEDSDPSFWNAFDFVGMSPSWSFVTPVGRVQICYLSGGTFTDASVAAGTVGGTWTCSDVFTDISTASAFLAAVADKTTIEGLRFQYAQGNDLGWQNPTNPVVSTPFQIVRRVDLRTGEPVPTTRADQTSAPGETQAGFFTDTVTVDSTSAQITAGQSLTAHASADAQYRNLHLTAQISVTKSPNGDVRPGVAVPYTLTFTNAGEEPLAEPTFTDRLPVDSEGAQLIFDPDRDPSVPPWTFALAGAAPTPPDGTPLPTDPALVDVGEADNVITFTMPDGSVLEPGQTYTITILLMLRPGLTPDDHVTNVAGMKVNVPLDACVPFFDPATGECQDDATVQPLAVPALSTIKYVKGDAPPAQAGVPSVISTSAGFSCDNAADSDGFYRSPCVPVTDPGSTETWRFAVTNAGTLPLDQVVSIDNLPTPGDQGLIVTLPRDSAWPPTWVGDISLAGAPAGASLTTFYSTSSVPCTADLNPIGTQCAPGAWLPLDASVAPASVKSVKFVVTMAGGALFQPGQAFDIEFQTRTTPTGLSDSPYPTAWNTVSTGGAAVSGASRVVVPATEGRRVGVSYPTGQIELQKVLTGPASGLAPATFPVQLSCASAGMPVTGLPTVNLVPGADPVTVSGLPIGSVCTAVEGQFGQTQTTIGTATVGGPDDEIGLVTVTNDYQVADLTIRKEVDSDAVNQRDNPVSYGPFSFQVTCTFLGEDVFATGYDADHPMEASIDPDETWSLAGLPVGADCVVTETDTVGATGTSMTVTDGDGSSSVDGTSATVTVGQGTGATVVATNEYGDGALALTKVVEGDAAADFGGGPFLFTVQCVLDTGSGTRVVWAGFEQLGGDQPLTATIDHIAAGASCTVQEVDAAGATTSVVDPGTVTIGDGQTVTVTATNTFDAGALTVTKVVTGDGADLWGTGPFGVTLTCLDASDQNVAIPGGATRALSSDNGFTTTYAPLLVGLSCSLEETDTGGATSTTITDTATGDPVTNVTIGAETPGITVTNTFDVGTMVVSKTLSGNGAAAHRDDTFEVAATCTWNGEQIDVPGGASRPLSVGSPATYADLPVGAACTVSETSNGGAEAVRLTPADPDDASKALVMIGTDAEAAVTIDNTFDPVAPAGPDGLADTGAGVPQWATLGGIALLAIGGGVIALLIGRRRRRA